MKQCAHNLQSELYDLEYSVKVAVESFQKRKPRIAIVLDTLGGIVEVVEYLVQIIRYHYDEVDFLIPRPRHVRWNGFCDVGQPNLHELLFMFGTY